MLIPVGEGVAGALHWKELIELCKEVGFCGPHLVTARPFVIEPELRARRPLGRGTKCFNLSPLKMTDFDRCMQDAFQIGFQQNYHALHEFSQLIG